MPRFVGVNREIVKWEWHDDAYTMNLLLHLLVLSADEPTEYHGVKLEVGQLITTVSELSRLLKQTTQKVRTGLERLKKSGIITIKTTNKNTVITVEKSRFYVLVKEKTTNEITNEQQTNNKQETNKTAETEQKNGKEKATKKSSRPCEDYTSEFETFWAQYPRHTAKKNAFKAWRAVNPKDINPTQDEQEAILHDIAVRLGRGEWQEERYIPHASTYLNGRRWEDEQTAIPQKGTSGLNVGKGYYNPAFEYAERLRAMEESDHDFE